MIETAKAAGMACLPGVATPSEAFAALRAGADALKLFPAETLGPAAVKAWRAVLPAEVALLPVGGITPDNMAPWRAAGAAGFGLGSALYRPAHRRPRSALPPSASSPPGAPEEPEPNPRPSATCRPVAGSACPAMRACDRSLSAASSGSQVSLEYPTGD